MSPYTRKLEKLLYQKYPEMKFVVTNLGKSGEKVTQGMVDRVKSHLVEKEK